MENIEPAVPKVFISYPYMIVIMAVLQIMTIIYGARDFLFFGFDVSAGWIFLMPIMLYIFQISAEVYGWQYARQMIWLNLLTNSLFVIITYLFQFIPKSKGIVHNDLQSAYITLMDKRYIAGIMMSIAIFVSDFVTSTLLCWIKVYFHGRYLILRLIFLHILSELIIISTGFILDPLKGYSLFEAWIFARDAFYARTICMFFLLPFARFTIWYLQNYVEQVMVFDYKDNFSFFKLSIKTSNAIYFNISSWKKTDVKNLDVKKIAKDYYASRDVINIKI